MNRIAATLRRISIATCLLAAASCGGESVKIDVRNPPPILKSVSRMLPSKPVGYDDIVAPCAADGVMRVMAKCEVIIKESSSMIRKVHLYVGSGGPAVLSYTPNGGGDPLQMKATPDDPAHMPIRKAGGTLTVTCPQQCVVELRPE